MNLPLDPTLLALAAAALLVVAVLATILLRWERCPADRVLVVSGRGGSRIRCLHGGGTFVRPFLESKGWLSLTPLTVSVPAEGALTRESVRLDVPSTVTVAVSTDPELLPRAAERLLGLKQPQIEDLVREIAFGRLRLTISSLPLEQIATDRAAFVAAFREALAPELASLGLETLAIDVLDVRDDRNYLETLGKKAAAEVVQRSMVDVADQEQRGAVGRAAAERERTIRVAESLAAAEKEKKKTEVDQRRFLEEQEAAAVESENAARARIVEAKADLAIKEATARQRGEVARKEAEVEVHRVAYRAELERLRAAEVVREEIEKAKAEIAAGVEADQVRTRARAEADAILLRSEAEARGLRQVLESKAAGYRSLLESCDGDARAAATLLLVEKLEDIVRVQVDAIRNLKIDKVTVWDSGNGEKGSGTAAFASGLLRTIPPLHEVARMAGVELPEFLGSLSPNGNAASVEPATAQQPATAASIPPPSPPTRDDLPPIARAPRAAAAPLSAAELLSHTMGKKPGGAEEP